MQQVQNIWPKSFTCKSKTCKLQVRQLLMSFWQEHVVNSLGITFFQRKKYCLSLHPFPPAFPSPLLSLCPPPCSPPTALPPALSPCCFTFLLYPCSPPPLPASSTFLNPLPFMVLYFIFASS